MFQPEVIQNSTHPHTPTQKTLLKTPLNCGKIVKYEIEHLCNDWPAGDLVLRLDTFQSLINVS